MTRRHHIRNSIKNFVERHTDAENHLKLKKTHKDMEERKNRLLSLMESQQDIDVSKDESKRGIITELIEEFYREYESLYTHYDALTEELKIKVQHKDKPKDKFSSSSDSDSDSDHSSEEKGLKNEVAELKDKLEVISNDKTALESDYTALSNKLHDSDRLVQDLKVEAEKLNQEKSELLAQNEQLKQKLDTKVNGYMADIEALTEQVNKLTQETNSLQEQRSKLESEMENENTELRTKVKTLTEDLSKRVESKEDIIVAQLERTIEGLRRENNKAIEKTCTFEAQLRLAHQKVRVTDQLLNEDEQTHKIALQKYEDRYKSLEQRIATNNKAYCKIIIGISESMKKSLAGLESVAEKCEDKHEKFANKLTMMSKEIHILKHFTPEKNILKTMEELNQVLREKDEQLSILGEEKRQAIKQLCMWWDDTKSRYDHLKNVVSKAASETYQRSR